MNLATVRTVSDAIKIESPSIGSLCRAYDIKRTKAYIKLWVADLAQSVNVKRELTEHQVDEIALYVTTEYRNLTIVDINLIFKNAKLGRYGQFYESIDVVKVLGWCNDYQNERIEAFQRKNDSDHGQTKHQGNRSSTEREDNTEAHKAMMKYNTEKLMNKGK